jgi:hypothetical protein
MKLPASYTTKRYLQLELAGAGIILILLVILLTKSYISFHWLKETCWLAAVLILVVPELTRDKPLMKYPAWLMNPATPMICSLYLFLYHFFICYFRLRHINPDWMLHASVAVLFAISLLQRAVENGIAWKAFNWKNLLRFPHWPFSIGALLCMLAPFFKMTRFYSLRSNYGMQFGYNAYDGWGYNNWGNNYYSVRIAIKGYYAYWGHLACILLAFILILHIVRACGNKSYPLIHTLMKIAVPAALVWWIFGARGYQSLKSFGNILFIPGILMMLVSVFIPEELEKWTRKRDLIK